MARARNARTKGVEPGEKIVEEGDIYFLYRPRVEETEVEGLRDIQRFFVVMKPRGDAPFRVMVLGRKHLPEAERHERIWGFVDAVTKSGGAIEAEFKARRYSTKTRGERVLPAVRPVGEGVYALIARDRNLHLTYELELPQRPGEVQEALNIEPQGAYILSIKNPERPPPPGAGLSAGEEANYPDALQRQFDGRRFATTDPRLLDYEGAEFVLVGARTNPERAYDIDLEAEHETAETADIFRQLRMSRDEHPLEPRLKAEWR
jgi:hypothetical protein